VFESAALLLKAEPSDGRKSPVSRVLESKFFGGDCVIAVVRRMIYAFPFT
jgi:hypothetical protein